MPHVRIKHTQIWRIYRISSNKIDVNDDDDCIQMITGILWLIADWCGSVRLVSVGSSFQLGLTLRIYMLYDREHDAMAQIPWLLRDLKISK